MRRLTILYLLLLVLPALGLGLLLIAWSMRTSPLEALRLEARQALGRWTVEAEQRWGELARDARAYLEGWREAFLRRDETVWPLVFIDEAGGIAYHPGDPASGEGPAEGETELYRLSRSGGDALRHEQDRPGEAVEAYCFFLDRIAWPPYRAELLLAAEQAAAAAGRSDLARGFRDALRADHGTTLVAGGFPVAVLTAGSPDEACARLEELAPMVPTTTLAALAAKYDCDALAAELVRRRRIESLLTGHSPRARSLRRDGLLLLFQPESAGGRHVQVATWIDLGATVDPRPAGRFEYTFGPPGNPDLVVATAAAHLPDSAGELEVAAISRAVPALRSSERWYRGLTVAAFGLLLVLVVGGGLLLARLLLREHHIRRLQSDLVANLSHELKTPASTIRLFAEFLARGDHPPERRDEYLRILAQEGAELGAIVDQFLTLDRLTRGTQPFARTVCDIEEIVGDITRRTEARCRAESVAFERTGDRLPALATDPEAVRSVLRNLLDNAIKYRRPEGAEVTLRTSVTDDRVAFSIEDNGPGIAPEHREKVFEPFFRLGYDDVTRRGAGLGLAVARRLARSLGGDIVASQRTPAGSTFTFHVPRHDGQEAAEDDDRRHRG